MKGDEDQPDQIDFIEFLSIMARLTLYKQDQSLLFRNAFNVFADKDGHIHLGKLKDILYKIGEPLEDPEEFNQMCKQMGKNINDTIDFDDFEKINKKDPNDFI